MELIKLLLFSLCLPVWAAGVMQLSGKVHGFDKNSISVSDGRHIYKLKRSAIQTRAVASTNLKVGEYVALQVSMDGVLEARPLKK